MSDEKPKHPGGAPTKYKPEYCQMLIKHMAKGKSYATFAGVIEVGINTMKLWEKDQPEFLAAKDIALAKNLDWWEAQGMSGLWEEKDGPKFNERLYMLNMRNRHRWLTKDPESEEESNNKSNTPNVIINIPSNGREADIKG